jgi:hypothetical protein
MQQDEGFWGGSLIELAHGGVRCVRNLRRGDRLADDRSVVCVVEIPLRGATIVVGDAAWWVTPDRAIMQLDRWRAARYVPGLTVRSLDVGDTIFDVLTDDGGPLVFDCGTLVRSLGHDDGVGAHSCTVVRELELMSGWTEGRVVRFGTRAITPCRRDEGA